MAISNHERVDKAMDLLKAGLGPFAEREFTNAYQAKAASQAALQCRRHYIQDHGKELMSHGMARRLQLQRGRNSCAKSGSLDARAM